MAADGRYGDDAVVATVGGVDVALTTIWPVRRPRPFRERLNAAEALHTGQRVLDLLYPVARGSSAAVPGGFGTGKTVLLQQIAKWCDADVIVYVGCGERGNEMADVVEELGALEDPRTGDRLSRRTVIIANTSNMPMMAREASIYTGVTVAEYFRDMGYHVVVIADSTSRWAEALREFASRTGALPAEEGYPAGLASALAAFYERAGHVVTLGGRAGRSPSSARSRLPGGDMTEPVTAHTQRFVRSVWTLDRDLAYARHYPAVAWSGSFSRDADALGAWHARRGDPSWARRRERVSTLLSDADRLGALAELVGVGSDAGCRAHGHAGRAAAARRGAAAERAEPERRVLLRRPRARRCSTPCSRSSTGATTLVGSGVPAATIEETDFGDLLRAAQETGPDDVTGVQQRLDAMLTRLEELS